MDDPYRPGWLDCDTNTWTWSGCLWTIEFLKLDGRDLWEDHSWWTWAWNWIIDTWVINEDFTTSTWVIAWSEKSHFNSARDFTKDNFIWDWVRQPLFPDTINVKSFEVLAYPNIDRNHAWKDNSPSTNINPYLRIKMTLAPSWKKRAEMKWEIPDIEINTTINLSDYFSW